VWFEILEEEKARIVEMVEELTLIEEDITPKVSQENGRTTNKKKTAPRKVQPKKPIKEQDVFKRISYVRQNQKRPPQSTRRVSDSEMTAYNSAEADASPIFTYAKFGDAKTVRKLLDDGADVNQEHTSDGSVLQQAARSGSLVLVQLVLDYGGDILACGGHWGTALQAASAKAAHPATISMVKLLLENGAEVEAQGGHYGNALQAAAAFYGLTNNSTVVELLLDAGAKVNAMGGEYGSALSVASYKGAEKLVRLLVERGADVDAPSPWGSALQAAVSTEYGGGDEVARLLVEYGADVNIQGGDCGSALHCAAMKNKEWAVRLLVDNGAEVNVAVQGKTALDIAAELGLENIVTILLEGGAAPLQ
jgi:ankyrin repeat protein